MSAVGRYRKIYQQLWRHPRFRALKPAVQVFSFYTLTGPQTNRIGLVSFSPSMAADDLETSVETVRGRLADVRQAFDWRYDDVARVLYIPSWWKWNHPENVNVLRGNLKDLNDVAPCALAEQFSNNLRWLAPDLHLTFREGFERHMGERLATQEHVTDQETEQKQGAGPRRASAPKHGSDGDISDSSAVLAFTREAVKLNGRSAGRDTISDTVREIARRNGHAVDTRAVSGAIEHVLSEPRAS